jgi:hypothetical protein
MIALVGCVVRVDLLVVTATVLDSPRLATQVVSFAFKLASMAAPRREGESTCAATTMLCHNAVLCD